MRLSHSFSVALICCGIALALPAAADEQRSSRSSPLAKVYMQFIAALGRCNKSEVAKHASLQTAAEIRSTSDADLKAQCRFLKSNARTDFHNATESITGNRATIRWEEEESHTTGDSTFRMSTSETLNFVKENGVWKFGE